MQRVLRYTLFVLCAFVIRANSRGVLCNDGVAMFTSSSGNTVTYHMLSPHPNDRIVQFWGKLARNDSPWLAFLRLTWESGESFTIGTGGGNFQSNAREWTWSVPSDNVVTGMAWTLNAQGTQNHAVQWLTHVGTRSPVWNINELTNNANTVLDFNGHNGEIVGIKARTEGSWGGRVPSYIGFYVAPRINTTTCPGPCNSGQLCSFTCTTWECAPTVPPTVSPLAAPLIPFGNPGTPTSIVFQLVPPIIDRILYYKHLEFRGSTSTGVIANVTCAFGTASFTSDSFTVVLEDWYKGHVINVEVVAQSVASSPTQVVIDWQLSGDSSDSGSNSFAVDAPVPPEITSPSIVWLNETTNTLTFVVTPSKLTYNYAVSLSVTSPNGAVSPDPNSLTTTLGSVPSILTVFIGHFDTAVTIQLDLITNIRDPVDIIVEFQGTGWGLVHTASVNIPVECGNYYYGTNCEGFDCNGNPCQNDGACVAPDVCNCDNTGGYFGRNCTEYDCALSGHGECMHGGTCYDVPGTPPQFLCDCSATNGYYGPTCEQFDCNGTPCQNNGTCVAPDTCDCSTANGYYGTNCSEWNCDGTPCMNGGECVGPDECSCINGWFGPTCDESDCNPPCQYGGNCVAPNTCSCVGGYFGLYCEKWECSPNCTHGGNCVAPNTCNCTDGYYGPICDDFDCYGQPNKRCANGGVCAAPDVCSCVAPYTGTRCEDLLCFPQCVSGICQLKEGSTTLTECNCFEGWLGDACDKYNCTLDCVNGNCDGPAGCTCFRGYEGLLCEHPVCNPPCPNTTEGGFCVSPNVCNGTLSSTEFMQEVEEEENSSEFPMEIVIGASVAGAVLLFAILAGVMVCILRRSSKNKHPPSSNLELLEFSGFGKYIMSYKKIQLGNKLGEGNFGEVYKGVYNHTDVAIKKVHEKLISQKDLLAFEEEAKLMGELPPHPNVVMFRGVTVPPDPFTIVLDFCNGGSLHTTLKSGEDISKEKEIEWALDIATGMAHLQYGIEGREIIHRDLAARNILLNNGRALVSDFGMARLKESEEDASKTQSNVGPLKWCSFFSLCQRLTACLNRMAPESLSKQEYSKASDVFSYGVVLWEITHRSMPWPGKTAVEASHLVISGERMPINDDVTPILATIMKQCWKEDPKDRPSFELICNMLKKYKEEEHNDEDSVSDSTPPPTYKPTEIGYLTTPI